MNWLNELKIAILNSDTDLAYKLIIDVPLEKFSNLDDMLDAQALILQGIELLEKDKQEYQRQMLQIKLAQKFLESE